jgi:hypothetical protein
MYRIERNVGYVNIHHWCNTSDGPPYGRVWVFKTKVCSRGTTRLNVERCHYVFVKYEHDERAAHHEVIQQSVPILRFRVFRVMF